MITRRTFVQLGSEVGAMSLLGSLLGCKDGGAPIEASRIKSVRCSYGGGMTGGGESSELARQKDGTVTLVTSEREWHNSRERTVTYTLDESAFERFAEIANTYDLRRASKRKMSDLIAYDAATGTISYTLTDENGGYDINNSFRIHSNQELTDHEREGYRAVFQALAELAGSNEGVESIEPITASLSVRGVQYRFFLNESSASHDLAGRCPLTVEIENYSDNEKIFYLDSPLDVSDTPLATGAAGTICYYAPWNDAVIFYGEAAPAEGLYELGVCESAFDVQYIAEIEPGEAHFSTNFFVDDDGGEADAAAVGSICYVSYRNGGGMDGGSESISLIRDENGDVVLEYERSEAPGDEAEPERFVLGEGAFDEFLGYVDEYGLRDASERPESEIQALDAPTRSITFGFSDEDGDLDADSLFTVTDTQDLTDEQRDGFDTVITALEELRSQQ
jgi:hypothetical protein